MSKAPRGYVPKSIIRERFPDLPTSVLDNWASYGTVKYELHDGARHYSFGEVARQYERVKAAPTSLPESFTERSADEEGREQVRVWVWQKRVAPWEGKGLYRSTQPTVTGWVRDGCKHLGGKKLSTRVLEYRPRPGWRLWHRVYLLKDELDAIAAVPESPPDGELTFKGAYQLAKKMGSKVLLCQHTIEKYATTPHPKTGLTLDVEKEPAKLRGARGRIFRARLIGRDSVVKFLGALTAPQKASRDSRILESEVGATFGILRRTLRKYQERGCPYLDGRKLQRYPIEGVTARGAAHTLYECEREPLLLIQRGLDAKAQAVRNRLGAAAVLPPLVAVPATGQPVANTLPPGKRRGPKPGVDPDAQSAMVEGYRRANEATGIKREAYAQQHGIPIETLKRALNNAAAAKARQRKKGV